MTPLNSNAPGLHGLAGVNIPKPGSVLLVAAGVFGVLVYGRRRAENGGSHVSNGGDGWRGDGVYAELDWQFAVVGVRQDRFGISLRGGWWYSWGALGTKLAFLVEMAPCAIVRVIRSGSMRRIVSLFAFLTAVFAVVLHPVAIQARPIVSIEIDSGNLLSVDPFTGAVTTVGPSGTAGYYFPISSSPVASSYFALSPINHYLLKYPQAGAYGTPDFALWDIFPIHNVPNPGPEDFAYDSVSGRLFALARGFEGMPAGLLELHDTGAPISSSPNSHLLSGTYIARAPDFPAMTLIEAIDGVGLFGTDGHAAYMINEVTGLVTVLPPLVYAGPTLTGIAYDPDSGRLIGVNGPLFPIGGVSPISSVFRIEPMTGQVTLLNSNAPGMHGLAGVNVPEPGSVLLVAAGFFGVLATGRRRAGIAAKSTR